MTPRNVLLCATAIIISAGPAYAANLSGDSPKQLEEIVVTAQKRSENLQKVPVSIAVAQGVDLKNRNIASLSELQRVIPGFNLKASSATSNGAGFTIRGIGTNLFGGGIQGSVGVVIDGVVMGRQSTNLLNFNDIDRVEILRGPQGTLFGMNASAGLISIATKDPTNELTGNLSLGYSSYNEIKADGGISGALIADKLLFRLSAFADKRDGYIHNLFDGRDLSDDNQKGARGKLLYKPSDHTQLKLSVDYASRTRKDVPSIGNGPARALTRLPVAGNPFEVGSTQAELYFLTPISGPEADIVNTTGTTRSTDRIKGISLQWDQDIGDFKLTSITAHRTWNQVSTSSLDGTPLNGVGTIPAIPPQYPTASAVATDFNIKNNSTFKQHQTTQELRIASPKGGLIDYIGGIFLFDQKLTTSPVDQVFLLAPNFIGGTSYGSTVSTLNYAAFADVNIHPADQVTVFGGGRWTHERVNMTLIGTPVTPTPALRFSVPLAAANQPGCGAVAATACGHDVRKIWSWRGGARWEVTPNSMLYATVARGFKGAGFNTNSAVLGNPGLVNPEISTNYEIGFKSKFFENRLKMNLALFYETIKDFQTTSFVQGIGQPTGVGAFVPANAGKLRSKGVEFEAEALPFDGLTVNLNAAYIDAIYKQFLSAPCYTGEFRSAAGPCFTAIAGVRPLHQDLSGSPLANTPKWSVNASANYNFELPGTPFDAFIRGDYSWRSKVQWDPNQDPRGIERAYGLFGASAGIQDKSGRYRVTIYGKNLTNVYHTDGIYPGATTTVLLPTDYRRVVGVTLDLLY